MRYGGDSGGPFKEISGYALYGFVGLGLIISGDCSKRDWTSANFGWERDILLFGRNREMENSRRFYSVGSSVRGRDDYYESKAERCLITSGWKRR